MNNEDIKQEISDKVNDFCKRRKVLLSLSTKLRQKCIEKTLFFYERYNKINIYLSEVKIMIITANEIERDTLFAYFSEHNSNQIVKIAKDNIIYSFFKIGDNKVVHIEPSSIGAYAHGGSASTVLEAIKIVKPSIVISLGVAFGANYKDNEIGDVLVGRQHFSYDKATKVSDGKLKIKKLHIEECDDYMLSRFKSNVGTEENNHGFFDNPFKVVLGNMVTGEFVVDSVDMRNMIFSPFQPFDIVGGEMEAYGIFEEIKKIVDMHCILMKGICDWGAGKNDEINIEGINVTVDDNDFEDTMINPKNSFQTLAMLNTCTVCEKFLISKKVFDDLHIKGFKKWLWRIFKFTKHRYNNF